MMKRQGRGNLKNSDLLRADTNRIHLTLLVILVGVVMFCGCNKTPPAENSALRLALQRPPRPHRRQTRPRRRLPVRRLRRLRPRPPLKLPLLLLLLLRRRLPRSTRFPVVLHLPSGFPRNSVQKPVTSVTLFLDRWRNLSVSRE